MKPQPIGYEALIQQMNNVIHEIYPKKYMIDEINFYKPRKDFS